MTIELFLARYGVFGIFIGAGIEGEAVAVTGGILAHREILPLWTAMLASTCGSFVVDQLWFQLGRHCRNYRWIKAMSAKRSYSKAHAFLERHPTAFIFGFRFVYGLRTVGPIAIGMTQVSAPRFVVLNAVAAAIWGSLFTLIGFEFGRAIAPLFHRIQAGAFYIIASIILGVLIAVAVARWRRAGHDNAQY